MAAKVSTKFTVTTGVPVLLIIVAAMLLSKKVIIVWLLLCILVALIWSSPSISLFILFALVPLNRSLNTSLVSLDMIWQVKTLLVYLVGIAWLLKYRPTDDVYIFPKWIKSFIIVWFTIVLLSTIYSIDILASLQYLLFTFSAVFLFIVCLKVEKDYLRRIIYLLVFALALLLIIFRICNHHVSS